MSEYDDDRLDVDALLVGVCSAILEESIGNDGRDLGTGEYLSPAAVDEVHEAIRLGMPTMPAQRQIDVCYRDMHGAGRGGAVPRGEATRAPLAQIVRFVCAASTSFDCVLVVGLRRIFVRRPMKFRECRRTIPLSTGEGRGLVCHISQRQDIWSPRF